MKLVKKWLFPILTCLIVAGAVVLPPYISHIRDNRQFFGQIHTSELDAEALPVWEGRDLLERLELYARWHTDPSEIIPSFQAPIEAELVYSLAYIGLAEQALDHLAQADIIPAHFLQYPLELIKMDRILLWDPTENMGSQEPVQFWKVTAYLNKVFLWITIDGESGLPLEMSLSDPDMARWLSYKDPDALPGLAERFFDIWELKSELVQTLLPLDAAPWEWRFVTEGTEIQYWFSLNPTTLTISLGQSDTPSHIVLNTQST